MKITPAKGFTLIELMVTVGIIGILAAVALPSYNSQIRKSRRSDAIVSLSKMQQAQERWRSNNATYGTLTEIAIASASPDGYYTLSVDANPTASTYTVKATAVSSKSQNSDTNCTILSVSVANGSATPDPLACWSK